MVFNSSIFTSFEAETIILRFLRIKESKPFSVIHLISDSQISKAHNSGLYFKAFEIRMVACKESLFHYKGQMPKRNNHSHTRHIQSVQFSHSVISDSLWPHKLKHTRPPCPSPTPGVHPNSCPLSRWCHSTISSSVVPFFSCPQSFPISGSFQMSQLFTSGGQSIGVSPSTSVLPVNTRADFL